MESPTSLALEKAREKELKPFLAIEAVDCSTIFNRKRIIVLTDKTFEVFSKTGEKSTDSFSWLDLVEIDMPDEEHIHLKFKRTNFNLSSDEIKTLISGIIDTVQRYLTKGELKEMEYSLNFFKSTPTPISIYNRFSQKLADEDIGFDEEEEEEETYEYFRDLFYTERQHVSIDSLPRYMEIAPVFFDTLPLIPFIQSVTVPPIISKDTDNYGFLIDFIAQPSYLRHIEIKGKTTDSFPEFMNQLKDNTRSRLNGISFTNSDFTIDHLMRINEAATARQLTSLGFHNAISQQAKIYFCSTFFSTQLMKTLKMLDLSGTTGLDCRVMFQKIRGISVLSLENCNTEIAEIFTALTMTSLPQLKVLNISGNPFTIPIPSSPNLPHNIHSIVASGITFPENHLVTFISFLFARFQKGLKLTLSNALASTDEWFRLFNFLQKTQYESLTALTWDSNPTYPPLFEFLARNRRLEYLSLSGCFYESNQTPIGSLADLLESTTSLRYLILRGNKTSYFGKYTVAVLTVIRQLTSLEKLDISFNNGGDESILALKILASELPHLKVLSYDGSRPSNSAEFIDLLQLGRTKESPIDITWPEADFAYLVKRLVLTDEEVKEQKEKALTKPVPCTITKNKEYSRPANSSLDEPCILSVDNYTTKFPTFLASEEIKALGAEQVEDETYVPETVALEYNVDDAPYMEENVDSRSIASLNYPNSVRSSERRFNAPSSPLSVRSLRNVNFDEDSSMSKKRTVASILRRAKSERAESVEGTPDSPGSQKSGFSRERQRVRSIAVSNRSGSSRRAPTKRIISPYNQGLTAENVERHSWEFPGNIEIHFDDDLWKEAASEFTIQALYDEIREEKGASSPKSERKSVSSKRSRHSK